MRSLFPNAVEYFVSYYDYYQPEAYVPRSDTYIEKNHQSMNRLTVCAIQQRAPFLNAMMSLLLPLYRVSTVSGRLKPTRA